MPVRKPTALLEASGAFIHNPQRRRDRENEPVPTSPLGDPPETMSAVQKRMWIEFAAEIPPGVAFNSDRALLEMAVRLRSKLRSGKASGGEYACLITCIREMGMTPVSRSKVKAVVEKEKDEWDEFDAMKTEIQ